MSVFLQILHHPSMSWKITLLYFFNSNIIYFCQKEPIKVQIFETFKCLGYNSSHSLCQFWNDKSIPFRNCALFFVVMTHNSSANFKLIHFLLWINGSYESLNFETFACYGEDLPNSSWHFPNHKSVFPQILRHSSVSWKATPLYFFRSNFIYFGQKEPVKVQIFESFECSRQISPNSCHFQKKK